MVETAFAKKFEMKVKFLSSNALKFVILPSIVFIFPIIMTIGIMLGIVIIVSNSSGATEESTFDFSDMEVLGVSEAVMAYLPVIERYAEEHDIVDYIPVIMAIMMQESGGAGNDPMQSSESYCASIGCIVDPEMSIERGIIHFKNVLELSNNNLMVAIQSYNYGTNFVHWIAGKGGEYSLELAIEYSRELYEKEIAKGRGDMYRCNIGESASLNACYGDYLYVPHVLRYLSYDGVAGEIGTGVWKNPLTIPLNVTSPFRSAHRPDHNGVDFSCNRAHIPIKAVDNGTVVVSTFGVAGSGFGGYGNVVVVKHSNSMYSLYAHLHDKYVKVGDKVDNGTPLGTCGNTGQSEGIHLHLEARTSLSGGHIDPLKFLIGK